jgi:lysophospholipase L1-like esterase
VTIPQAGWMINAPERIQLNRMIRELAGRCKARMGLLDLENAFDQNVKENHKYWSPDLLHLSPLGYDAFGEMLHRVMMDFQVTDQAFSLSCLD